MAEQINQSDNQDSQNQNSSIAAEFLQQDQTTQSGPVQELHGHKAAMDHWGVTGKTIQDWIKKGMPISGSKKKRIFVLADCEPWVAEYRRQFTENDSVPSPTTEPKPAQSDRETINRPHRGDPCPNEKCPGKLSCYSQSRIENGKIYFLSCARCNSKPKNNKEVRNFG